MMQTCAPCHARNELLTERFQPGDSYHDHYRIILPVDAAIYYPDGQQRDEDFNWTSVLLSRMGQAGVTCLDCHDPHTAKTVLPITDNQLCQQCHAAPGRTLLSGKKAVPIDPLAHSHHKAGSAGNSCVACHMPTTNYMQRAPRHDHGWLKPDPLLTKELGIPNACSRCHEDKGLEWTIAKADEWYGARLDSRQRQRARIITAAQADQPDAAEGLIGLLRTEDIPAWRATYLSLLAQTAGAAQGREAARASLRAADPLERAAAVRYFSDAPDAEALLAPLLKDPVRLVRLDAEWTLSPRLAAGSPERQELDAYLALTLDQPSGRLRLGQDLANRGDLTGAMKEMALAVEWDPYSPPIHEAYGMVLAAQGRSADAGAELLRAAKLAGSRGGPSAFRSGLAFAEANMLAEAENSFRLAVQCEPRLDRSWYNLGLLLARAQRLSEAAESLRVAERVSPQTIDYPYALMTVLLRAGDREGARAAAQRVLLLDPTHAGAMAALRALRQ
jgi:predicted CXXCH cytochrome family protein